MQKTAEATGHLIADKITSVSKNSSAELHSKTNSANNKTEVPKTRYMSPEKRKEIIDDLRLI